MPKFSKSSRDKLNTCHPDLIKVMEEAILHYDFKVLYGTRTPEEQFELFKKGRTLQGSSWVRTGSTVTDKDGTVKKSKHNASPSLAVDIAPYPIDWNDISRFKAMAAVVKEAAAKLSIKIQWGGDWKTLKDYPHFELKA